MKARLIRYVFGGVDTPKIQKIFWESGFRRQALLTPSFLSFVASGMEMGAMTLLIPVVRGLIEGDFRFITQSNAWLGRFVADFPIDEKLLYAILISLILLNTMGYLALTSLSRLLVVRTRIRLVETLRKRLFERYLAFGKGFFDGQNAGRLQSVLLYHSAKCGEFLDASKVGQDALISLSAYLLVMLWISPLLTGISIVILPLLAVATHKLMGRLRIHSSKQAQLIQEQQQTAAEAIACIPLMKISCTEASEKAKFDSVTTTESSTAFQLSKLSSLAWPIQELMSVTLVLVIVSLMVFLTRRNHGEASAFLLFFILIRRCSSAVSTINNSRMILATLNGSVNLVAQVFDEVDKVYVIDGSFKFEGLKSEISFRGLTFSYPKQEAPTLKNIRLDITKNQTIALIGQSGAGKTTLISLLLRFYNVPRGTIFIDERDICDVSIESLRSHIAVVTQDSWIFNHSLRYNLTYGLNRNISDEEIRAHLANAHLDEFVDSLPMGLETRIGDRGVRLSGGEKQRLAIARALLKKSEILIFDEATSSLDILTESLIQDAVNTVLKNRTAIIIAHRLSTIARADQIVVMEKGTIVEMGSMNILLARENHFYRYWKEHQALERQDNVA